MPSALVWLLVNVYYLMVLQYQLTCKAFITLATLIWFLAGVYSLMYLKVSIICKAFITFTALIWLVANVYSLIVIQDQLACKTCYHIGYIDMVSRQCVFSDVP